MEKFAAPIVAIVSVFLYFTHDAGFNFEKAKPEKRVAFVERQAVKTSVRAEFNLRKGPDAIVISEDQLRVRLKLQADGMLKLGSHRTALFRKACESYTKSYLDEHGITLRLEFYQDSGAMAGTMSLSPRVCAPAETMAS
ncbi:MAG: hypothetical protein ACK4P2_02000 [Hyphomonas sp.]